MLSAEKTPERVESQLIQKKVAYAMTDADRAKQVITEGGGGDRVSYYPYRDLEKAIRESLRSVYADVVVIRSAADANDATGQEVTRVLVAGSGDAEFSEFKSNFSLAASRAGTDLASKLSADIRANEKLR